MILLLKASRAVEITGACHLVYWLRWGGLTKFLPWLILNCDHLHLFFLSSFNIYYGENWWRAGWGTAINEPKEVTKIRGDSVPGTVSENALEFSCYLTLDILFIYAWCLLYGKKKKIYIYIYIHICICTYKNNCPVHRAEDHILSIKFEGSLPLFRWCVEFYQQVKLIRSY
jgi:hypothetical protein